MNVDTPTPFETIAAIVKFIAVPQISPEFFAKHRHAIDFAGAIVRVLAGHYPTLEQSLRTALPVSASEGGVAIQQALLALELPAERIQSIDEQITQVIRALLPVVRDAELPAWLAESRRAIEGAVHG